MSRGGNAIPKNSAESIKVGAGAFAVLHGAPDFGGLNQCCNDGWVNVAENENDPNLTDKVYRVPSTQNNAVNAFNSVSALWVTGTGCTPSRNQVSLFALPDQAGGCVSLSTGNYGGFDVAGLPNNWVSSLKVGTGVTATLYVDANFGTPSCDYAPNDAKNVCDSIDFDGRPELSSIKIVDLPSTPGTATLQVAQVAASGSAVVGSLAGGTPNKSYTLAFYAGSSCSDDRNRGPRFSGRRRSPPTPMATPRLLCSSTGCPRSLRRSA